MYIGITGVQRTGKTTLATHVMDAMDYVGFLPVNISAMQAQIGYDSSNQDYPFDERMKIQEHLYLSLCAHLDKHKDMNKVVITDRTFIDLAFYTVLNLPGNTTWQQDAQVNAYIDKCIKTQAHYFKHTLTLTTVLADVDYKSTSASAVPTYLLKCHAIMDALIRTFQIALKEDLLIYAMVTTDKAERVKQTCKLITDLSTNARNVVGVDLHDLLQGIHKDSLPTVGARNIIEAPPLDSLTLTIVDRNKVDSSHPYHFADGIKNPQLLPYVVVIHGDYMLTYSRDKGAEARLKGLRSIGFGGHIDYEDVVYSAGINDFNVTSTVINGMQREVDEELGIYVDDITRFVPLGSMLLDYSNQVGSVHLGLPYLLTLTDAEFKEFTANASEISDPTWVAIDELTEAHSNYEVWSQMVLELKA